MDDSELRGRLEDIEEAVERVESVSRGLSDVLTTMRVGDADARADVKIALSELRVASVALSDAAQSLQKSELRSSESSSSSSEVKVWHKVVFALLALLAAALGVKALTP